MRYLRTHAGQGKADRQDRGQGGRQKTHFAKSRLWPGRRWYLARELRSLMWKKGEQTRVVTERAGEKLSPAEERLAGPSHVEEVTLQGYSSPTPSQLASPLPATWGVPDPPKPLCRAGHCQTDRRGTKDASEGVADPRVANAGIWLQRQAPGGL